MSMEALRALYLRELQSRLGGLVGEMTRVRPVSASVQEAWHPAINAYRCRGCIVVCAELAGVERSRISVTVEARRVWLRGRRRAPEPCEPDGPPVQVLAMELDHGAFEREIVLPADVDPDRVRAEHRDGLLWITLPLVAPG